MKFLIKQETFAKALLTGSKSMQARSNLPVLANFLIDASGNRLEILSTDLETATKVRVDCRVLADGQTTVVGKTLLEYISALPAGEIEVEKLGEEVVLSSQGFKARLATIASEEFPAIPKIDKGFSFDLDLESLAKAINRVAFCAAQDEGRPILTGVLCEFSKGKITLVATDGYRLGFDMIEPATKSGVPAFKIIIPARSLSEVAKIIAETQDGEEEEKRSAQAIGVTVSEALNQINFKFKKPKAEIEFVSRLIEGEFPNWQKIIPTSFATRIAVDKQEFGRLVRIASIFARESGNIVRLKLASGKTEGDKKAILSVISQSGQVGSADASCQVEMTGGGGEIAFNFRYLLEVLAVISGEELTFEMNESLNPGKLTNKDAKDPYFHIIMPVRLQT